MMILVKNIEIYDPKYIGRKDVFICGGKIVLIEDRIEIPNNKVKVIDGSRKKMVPGFIDQHVHITGGGGEGSFRTRVPEITLSKLITAGITTVVGLLGTDSTTRSVENLVAKAKALKEEGITAYVLTGSYEYPTKTLTDSVKKDIVFIEEVIGAKVALSDHRSPSLSNEELARLASDVRVSAMLSGKAGILVVHMGNGEKGLTPINEVIESTDIPIRTIRPTHVNRNKDLLLEAFDYARRGGVIDLTCGIYEELGPGRVILKATESGVPLENITISSDGYGSWSRYDSLGNMTEIGVSQVDSIYKEFITMVQNLGFDIEKALRFVTKNVSKALNIYPQKGTIKEGSDGDVLILDENLEIKTVIANGRLMIYEGELLLKGTYE
ncbi:beta-aspartyl-peptidase [Paramaledivibacter caminithermalis]|jgi:beta-aspartyl-dipeptidase (metallo-type)|uniref:Isoaspartyl dipeptidase n=1 Tax=Paramaledivibacter caminithermalis (strain DSM 15212 / CIP 107654 / DViRD3) TaxID=1121301 RepID=A0A1M6MWY7_PARC5|nr:beta-aspartyl-peptidase [Paramaledivibacter caminithermalis]SHJ87900.1 isoaspartyl dipeptidase. Metallo peptidase. MEROPS family M38 [Paramaledivibacter caminithermalis DSM 15212]